MGTRAKQTEAPNSVDLNNQGFDQAEFEQKKKEKEAKLKRKLTPEEEKVLKERREELQKAKNAHSILRAISIRMPLLIFGADVPVDEKITLERFVKMVDEDSWVEFMPKGVTKKRFMEFIEYYDRDVFEGAGLQIRRLAKAADRMLPGPRVQQIARIFSYFKNPDKETVLTPWRVVNMHLSDTLGGWCFFGDDHEASDTHDGRARTPAAPRSQLLDEPRFVDRGEVTSKVFDPKAKILEINSKSGLYPLYVTYSIYRRKFGAFTEADIDNPLKCWQKWKETVADNVFVICKTPMAAAITRRTLVGYMTATVNARTFDGDLIETLKTKPETFTNTISTGKFWGKEDKEMKFDAIVGNPPYQESQAAGKSNVAGSMAGAIFPLFVDAAVSLHSKYVSLITPSRWMIGSGRGISKDWASRLVDCGHFLSIDDYPDASDCLALAKI